MISLITGSIGIFLAAIIVLLIRKDRLHVHHGLGWIIVAIGFALLGFSPGIFNQIAHFLGIGYPPVLGLTLAIAILVIKTLLMDIERSRIEMRNQRLNQRVAIVDADVKRLQTDMAALKGNTAKPAGYMPDEADDD